jgi:ubiquinone/menaquinone biosynthesis C-methylase UbiE
MNTSTSGNAWFQTPDYVDYLLKNCRPGDRADKGRVLGTEFIEQVLAEMNLRRGARVLEVGCGIGRIMQLMEGVWGVVAHGCDVSAPAIAEAKRLLPDYEKRLFVSGAEQIPIADQFDNFLFWGVFEMTEQRLALVEASRLLKIGGTAMLCAVKPTGYLANDVDSKAAHRAYIEKNIPITYTDIAKFEALLSFLGFGIVKRLVFSLKSDVAAHKYAVVAGTSPPPERCSDIYYIVEKKTRTPLDDAVQFTPAALVS